MERKWTGVKDIIIIILAWVSAILMLLGLLWKLFIAKDIFL